MAFLVGKIKLLAGDDVLALTKRDLVELLVGVHSLMACKGLDILDGVSSWGQDEGTPSWTAAHSKPPKGP